MLWGLKGGWSQAMEQGWLRTVPCCLFPSCVECCDPCTSFGDDVDVESHLSPWRPHETIMAGQGDSCFGLQAEMGVLLGGAEADPGSQEAPPVCPWSGSAALICWRCTSSPGLSAAGVATASCMTLSLHLLMAQAAEQSSRGAWQRDLQGSKAARAQVRD